MPTDTAFRTRGVGMLAPSQQDMRPSASSSIDGMLQSNRLKSADFRFAAGTFQYNARVAVALVPCVVLILGMGGKPVLGTLTIGLMISYILDTLQLRHGAFFGIWGSIFASQLAFILGGVSFSTMLPQPLYWLTVLTSFEANFLVGVWASLQFRWLQLENPSVVLALERLLFACIPFTAAAILTWGVVAAVGIQNSAFYLMIILCGLYWMFSLPHQSSFRSKTERSYGGQIGEEALILGPLDAAFHSLTLMFLPLLFFIGYHHGRIFSSANLICDSLMLFFVPFLFQLYASSRGALWWLAKDPRQFHQVRLVNGAISLVVLLICLEIRVIFVSFEKYFYIPSPWSYLFVTIALVCVGLSLGASGMGLINDAFSSVLFTGAMMLSAFSGSLVMGFPLKLLPVPLVSAFYISNFFVKRSLFSYFIFAITASMPLTWFVIHNLWFLNTWLAGLSVKDLCKHLIIIAILALAIPGFVLLPPKAHRLAELGLIAQALILCNLENRLYNYEVHYYIGFDADVLYPSYMVIVSTLIGLVLVRRLSTENRIDSLATWVLTCLYAAKISVLFLSSKTSFWGTAILLMAISPPCLLYKDKGKGVSRMKPWQGFSHAAAICISVWLCRYAIFESLQRWMDRSPSDGFVLGSIISLSGLACLPIVTNHFSHIQSTKRAVVLVVALGLLLIFIQPPVPKAWTPWWDSSHMPDHLVDDAAIYGLSIQKPAWPSWLLVFAISTSLAAFTSAIPVQYIVELRLLYAIGVGISVGIYVCTQYFMQASILHALLVVAMVCASVFLVFTHLPSASSPRFLPWIFALLVALLPVMYFVEGQLRFSMGENEDEKLVALLALEGSRMLLLGLYATIFMLISLQIKFELASLLKEKALEKGGRSWGKVGSNADFVPKFHLLQQRRQTLASAFTVKKLAIEGAWMPAVGNVATCLCFAICLILNIHLTGGSNKAIFFLAPILLLLNQDSNLFTGFGDRQRYFPLTVVISIYLVVAGAYRLWAEVWHGYQNAAWGLETGGPGLFFAVKNGLLLLLTVPNHVLFNCFMWNYGKQSDFVLLLITPLNLPAIIITDIMAIRALAL
eukprot:c28580_g1_i2 orf=3-3230(-)